MSREKDLEELIKYHKALYYQGRPEITDSEYDQLEDELKSINPENPILSIVGSLSSFGEKIRHDKKMLSLEKTYSREELLKWIGDKDVLSMHKLDGVSCSIIFKDNKLILAKTRGDGEEGENIKSKIVWMKSIPQKIYTSQEVEVRGEMYCTLENFIMLKKEMEAIGLSSPTSQRNIVAGLMGRKENLELCRYINFKAFDLISSDRSIKTEEDKFLTLKKYGFDIPEYKLHKTDQTVDFEIENARSFILDGDYQIDGLVFVYNDLRLHEELGETVHHPRYKMAYKFKGDTKQSEILDIEWGVSRNGILTPVANIAPTELSGAVINRVTLHNAGIVLGHCLKKGDIIEIIRSGEVIPKFLNVIKSTEGEVGIPKNCPSCGESTTLIDIRLFCLNKNCIGKKSEEILNYIQKINIEDLSSKRLQELMRSGLVKNIPDLYRITKKDFLLLGKTQEILATKLYESIQKSKKTDLITFLVAIGISQGAWSKCEKIIRSGFNTLEKIKNLTIDQLITIEGFAEKSAKDFISSLGDKQILIDELLAVGVEVNDSGAIIKDSKITGKKICITGSLSRPRNKIEQVIQEHGGIIVSSVSKATNYLLTNDKDSNSSKFKKAQELKIEILTEEELFSLFN